MVIEAFAHGVPVIGARSGGIPETIQPGISGSLFAPGDDAALAERITAFARDRTLVATQSAGALAAAARYAPDRIAAAYGAVFDGLAGKPAEGPLLLPREARS